MATRDKVLARKKGTGTYIFQDTINNINLLVQAWPVKAVKKLSQVGRAIYQVALVESVYRR